MTWPKWKSSMIKRGFPKGSLLENKEEFVWEALGDISPQVFEKTTKKQLVIREALNRLGLGWVATNTTPFRVAVGGLYDVALQASKESQENKAPDPEDEPEKKRQKTSFPFEIRTQSLPKCKGIPENFSTVENYSAEIRKAVWQHLKTYGAVVLPGFIGAIQEDDTDPMDFMKNVKSKPTKLSTTMGNGVSGVPQSVYADLRHSEEIQ
mmetsp:Transcript_66475/g.191903  ORF Transcript_66475/g.191903 Transcript_66475/m.191903 type:complete len:208 (+) Transcript_66475:215-838(+)